MCSEDEAASEEQIIKACKAGKSAAFKSLYDRCYEKGYRIAFRLLGDKEEAMEALQEAFVKAFEALPSFRLDSSFATWFFRIVVNASLDRRKARIRRKAHFEEALTEPLLSGKPKGSDSQPIEILESLELRQKVQEAIEQLSEDHRLVFVLFVMEGMRYREISRVLGISEGTVMSRLHYARRNLQEKLRGYMEE